jgi:hypothetical protein
MRGDAGEPMENQDTRTDLERYIKYLENRIQDDEMILRLVLKNKFPSGYLSLQLEPEGTVDFLNADTTFELILVVRKKNPEICIQLYEGGLNVSPDMYGAAFQDGKCVMHC